jgi:hypothetical protein
MILVVVAVATVALATAILNSRADEPGRDPSTGGGPAASVPPDPPSEAISPARLATGCVGGPDPATAVFTAQTQAPADEIGGVEFSTALVRWLLLYPRAADFESRSEALLSASPITTVGDLEEVFDDEAIAAGTSYSPSTSGGGYRIVDASASDVQADIAARVTMRTADGKSQDGTVALRVTSSRTDGEWGLERIESAPASLSPVSAAVGQELTPFVGGC